MLGPPGAGKGTQARRLSEALRRPHVSTGDMLREALRDDTELGRKARLFMEAGDLVPDELVDAIVMERLEREDCGGGFILDGYPRTIHQVGVLQGLLEKNGKKILTIGVEVRDSVLIQRLSSRWTCPGCGKMFNTAMDPDKAEGRCDACGERLTQRQDDRPDVIAERLQVYHRLTQPLIRHYQDLGAYVRVDGERSVEEVFGTIMDKIANFA